MMKIENNKQSTPSIWYVVVGLKGDGSPQWLANTETIVEAGEVQKKFLEELQMTGACGYVSVAKMVSLEWVA